MSFEVNVPTDRTDVTIGMKILQLPVAGSGDRLGMHLSIPREVVPSFSADIFIGDLVCPVPIQQCVTKWPTKHSFQVQKIRYYLKGFELAGVIYEGLTFIGNN